MAYFDANQKNTFLMWRANSRDRLRNGGRIEKKEKRAEEIERERAYTHCAKNPLNRINCQ